MSVNSGVACCNQNIISHLCMDEAESKTSAFYGRNDLIIYSAYNKLFYASYLLTQKNS